MQLNTCFSKTACYEYSLLFSCEEVRILGLARTKMAKRKKEGRTRIFGVRLSRPSSLGIFVGVPSFLGKKRITDDENK